MFDSDEEVRGVVMLVHVCSSVLWIMFLQFPLILEAPALSEQDRTGQAVTSMLAVKLLPSAVTHHVSEQQLNSAAMS